MAAARRIELARATDRYLREQEYADRSEATIDWYRQKLSQLARTTQVEWLDELTRDTLMDFVTDLREAGRSPHYLRGWYQLFRAFLGWCRDEGYVISEDLVNERAERWFAIRKPKQTEADVTIYSEDELEQILEHAGQPRNRAFIRLLVRTGLRLNEALGLRLDDLEESASGTMLRVRSTTAKGRKPRLVPVSTTLERELRRYIDRHRPESTSDRLFLSRAGTPWAETSVNTLFKRLKRETGLRVHAHAFRHTYATEYLRRGGEIERLRRILGHTTYTMVSRYVHLAGADLGRDIDKLTL